MLVADHVHHGLVERWLATSEGNFATCPITQGSLVRLVTRETGTAVPAVELLAALSADEHHEFWPDDRPYTEVPMRGVVGHRQVTDFYLAHLARSRKAGLATLDAGLAESHRDVARLVSEP